MQIKTAQELRSYGIEKMREKEDDIIRKDVEDIMERLEDRAACGHTKLEHSLGGYGDSRSIVELELVATRISDRLAWNGYDVEVCRNMIGSRTNLVIKW